MGSFRFDISKLGLQQKPQVSTFLLSHTPFRISCGLRNGPRKPMWRSRVLSTEAIQAVHSLKLGQNSSSKLEQVFSSKIARLLKADLLDALAELQRQNELDLAFKVFNVVRKEEWYLPDLSLFNNMIMMLGKHKMIEMIEQLLVDLRKEGLEPDSRTYTELIGAYFKVEMVGKAMETYEVMKASGLVPDKLTLTILIRNLENAGEEALTQKVKKECPDYFDSPKKFLKEVEKTYPKKKKLIVI